MMMFWQRSLRWLLRRGRAEFTHLASRNLLHQLYPKQIDSTCLRDSNEYLASYDETKDASAIMPGKKKIRAYCIVGTVSSPRCPRHHQNVHPLQGVTALNLLLTCICLVNIKTSAVHSELSK
jgi:hypothetical protein